MRCTYLGLLCAMGLAAAAPLTQAHAYAETGDAGQSLATAQTVPDGTTQITGELTANSGIPQSNLSNDVDIFRFTWGGGHFVANTFGSAHSDPMLSLFDQDGHGIQMDDDTGELIDPSQTGLQAYLDVANLAAGTYYIAISPWAIWAVDGAHGNDNLFLCMSQCGPVDATATLAGWRTDDFGLPANTYVINLPAQVPEPATFALIAGGLLGLGVARRRK